MKDATLLLEGREYSLPVFEGSENEVALDITALRALSGAVTYDPGYANTGACKSAITFLDGERGEDPDTRINRPRQIYAGAKKRSMASVADMEVVAAGR